MSFQKLRKINSRLNYKFACYLGYCPTLKERKNGEIKRLANKLKATSNKETLANILEWQNRNIEFWSERWILPIIFYLSLLFAGLFLLIFHMFDIQIFFWITLIFASSAITTLIILLALLKLVRKISLKDGLKGEFAQSIPLSIFLQNKLGVCRDFAKVTACLLFKMYPNAEIYFAHAPQHVATGIMIENRIYMLDQRLPVLTIDKWHERWHKHKYSEKSMEKVKGDSWESVDINSFLTETKSAEVDTGRLSFEMTKYLSIKEQNEDTEVSSIELSPWKKGAILYEDNEIVNYSLARRLKMQISEEMLELNQITKLEVIQNKDDLLFKISLK